jgi:hypothetical protein
VKQRVVGSAMPVEGVAESGSPVRGDSTLASALGGTMPVEGPMCCELVAMQCAALRCAALHGARIVCDAMRCARAGCIRAVRCAMLFSYAIEGFLEWGFLGLVQH